MEIFQFEQFQMIAECGTMREAADRLFLSQPTLSHNLKKLESELGCKLFVRAGNQLRLTPYGELVLGRTREIDGSFKAMLAEVEDMKRREEATLRIGSYSSEIDKRMRTMHGIYEVIQIYKDGSITRYKNTAPKS